MPTARRLGTIAGIDVRVHWSLLIVAGLLTLTLAGDLLPAAVPGIAGPAALVLGLTGAVLFLGSILGHELAHSLVAQRNGIGVKRITLWLLGGLAELEDEPRSAGAEFRIAIAGPAMSLGLAAVLAAAAVSAGLVTTPIAVVFGWLALVNVVLALFNLFPAAPLDGGRILRAALWSRSGDRWTAMATAAGAGRVFGGALAGLGVVQVVNGWGNGVWTVLLAWFVWSAASGERAYARQRLEAERQRRAAHPSAHRGPVVPAAVLTDSHPPRTD
jgi:Zn-dependent protease